MAHTKETTVLRGNTLEQWRQRTNKISYDLGAVNELHSDFTDSILNFTATADQTNFYDAGLSIGLAAEVTLDNTAGSIILAGDHTALDASIVAGEKLFQGILAAKTWEATIVAVTDRKILVTQSTGVFDAAEELVLTSDTNVTIAASNISSLIAESYEVGYVELYTNGVERAQTLNTVGFHLPPYVSRINLTGSPTVPASFVEGATIYQGTLGSETFIGKILYVEGSTAIHIKSVTSGSFSTSVMVKVGSGDTNNRVLAANLDTYSTIDQDHASMIELHSPADAGDIIKLAYYNTIRALNELADDIGTIESLTTTATNLVAGVNELDAEIGNTTEFSSVSATNNTVSTAIQKLHTEIGDITAIDALVTNNTSLVEALNELQGDIGNKSSLTTAAKGSLVAAVNEHDTDLGDMTFTGLDATDVSDAIRELRTDIGDVTAANMGTTASNLTGAMLELEKEIDTLNTRVEPTQAFHANFGSDTIMDGINELMTDIGNVTATNMGTTADTVVGAMLELETEIDTLNTYTGVSTVLTTTAEDLAAAINEHETDIGDMVFTGLDATDISTAIRELRTDLGDVTAANMGTTADTVVGAMLELETEIDTLNARVEPGQAFNAWFDSTTIMDGINELATEKLNLASSTTQTINSDVQMTTGNVFTIPSGATLDIDGTLLIGGGAGSTLSFDTAFIELASTASLEGIEVDRSKITGVAVATAVKSKLQWNEGKVGTGASNTSHRGWQLVGLTNESTPVASTADVVTFYNAKDLVSNNTETNMTVTWDSANQNFDFAINPSISITNVTASATLTGGHVATGTMATTGNVTIGGNLTVNGTATYINTETLTVDDNIIVLNDNVTATPTENAGVEIERGTGTNVSLLWNEASDRWTFTNNGSNFYNIPMPSEYDNYVAWTIQDHDGSSYTITSGDTLKVAEGNGIDSNFTADDVLTITNTKPFDSIGIVDGDGTTVNMSNGNTWKMNEDAGSGISMNINHTDIAGPAYGTTFSITNTDRGSSQNIFKTFTVDDTDTEYSWSATGSIVADNNADTAKFVSGNAINIDVDPANDAIRVSHVDTSTLSGTYGGNNNGVVVEDITVDSNGHVTAVGTRDLDGRYDNYSNWSLFVDNVDKDNVTSGEKVDFVATAPLSVAHTVSSGNVLTFTHDDSGVTAATYGTTGVEDGKYIKGITVNAKGHITAIAADDFDDRYNNYSHPNHSGDVTSVGDGSTTIGNNKVTFAKMQDIASQTFIGRNSANAGDPESLTAATARTILNVENGANNYKFKVSADGTAGTSDITNGNTLAFTGGTSIDATRVGDTITIAHSDTSSVADLASDNSGNTFIQDIGFTFDTHGHVTGATASTGTVSVAGWTLDGGLVSGTNADAPNIANNGTLLIDELNTGIKLDVQDHATGSGTLKIGHADTSSQASVNNSGRTYIQDITLDTFGHITAITSATETVTNTWRPIDDTPSDGATTTSISSNWAFDNVKTAVPTSAVFTDTNTVTRVKASGGSYVTGDITLYGTGATTVTQIDGLMTINSANTNTTYTAGSGLILTGTVFHVIAPNDTTSITNADRFNARAWCKVQYQVSDGYTILTTGYVILGSGGVSSVSTIDGNFARPKVNFSVTMTTSKYAAQFAGYQYRSNASSTSTNAHISSSVLTSATTYVSGTFHDPAGGSFQPPGIWNCIVVG